MYKIIFYCTKRNENLVMDFVRTLPEGAQRRVAAYLKLLEEKGPLLRHEYADILRDKIYELRPGFGRLEPRILYFYDGKNIILTHGFLKKTKAIPDVEIERALRIMDDYKNRKIGGKR